MKRLILAALALACVAACAPRQPPGGDLWRAVKHSNETR